MKDKGPRTNKEADVKGMIQIEQQTKLEYVAQSKCDCHPYAILYYKSVSVGDNYKYRIMHCIKCTNTSFISTIEYYTRINKIESS